MGIRTRGGNETQAPEPAGPKEPAQPEPAEPKDERPSFSPELASPMSVEKSPLVKKTSPKVPDTFDQEADILSKLLGSPDANAFAPERRISRRKADLVPEDGYAVPWQKVVPVVDHATILYWAYDSEVAWYSRLFLMPRDFSHHLFKPGCYLTLQEACIEVDLPMIVDLGAGERVCLFAIAVRDGQVWGVLGVDGEWTEQSLVKKPIDHIVKIIGPPTNELGKRLELTHANALITKHSYFKRVLKTGDEVNALIVTV